MTDMHVRRTYTPEQREIVEQFKSWAILYLQMSGRDPEARMEMPHPTIVGAKVYCQAWETIIPELYNEELKYLSMMATRQDRVPDDVKRIITQ